MLDAIPRLNAALEGRYRIERELGEGGMATVYLAEDLRHERNVALKVLKPELAAVVGAERFLAEIKTTANLQHPHILPLFDSGEADGFLFYVMPFVEGETLRERLAREKQLPVDEAVRIAVEVGEALAYAHGRDVVHRDIKPANILLQSGRVLVADFGIALAVSAAGSKRLTETGLSVGTPQYMSPEQATGDRDLDGRSDVYSLACVTYEMLGGDPPYTASTAQAILGKILTEDPKPLSQIRRAVPAHVEEAVTAALEKLPADRFATAADFIAALRGERRTAGAGARAQARPSRARWQPWAMAASSAAVGVAAGLVIAGGGAAAPSSLSSALLEIPVPGGLAMTWGEESPLAISPDGTVIAYITPEGITVRPIDSFETRVLPGTSDSRTLMFSPDGARIAFIQQSGLKWLPVAGGAGATIAELGAGGTMGGSWSDRGGFLLTGVSGGIDWLPESGGEMTELTSVSADEGENIHAWPTALPGTTALLYTALGPGGGWVDAKTVIFDPVSGRRRVIAERATSAKYVSTGHVIYSVGSGVLMVASLDLDSWEMGSPEPLVSDVRLAGWGGNASYDISLDGVLVWLTGSELANNRLVTLDRAGTIVEDFGPTSTTWFELSRSGTRLAMNQLTGDNIDMWIHDLVTGDRERFTFDINEEETAIWSPDDERLMWAPAQPGGGRRVLVGPVDGSTGPELVFEHPYHLHLIGWSPNGRHVAFSDFHPTQGQNLYLVDLQDSARVFPVQASNGNEVGAEFSPDGRWLAYSSDQNGRWDVFVVSVPDGTGRRQVSTGGGFWPIWSRDQRELYYFSSGPLSHTQDLLAREIRPGPGLDFGAETRLFSTSGAPPYEPSVDGRHFYTLVARPEARASSIRVMTGWTAGGGP